MKTEIPLAEVRLEDRLGRVGKAADDSLALLKSRFPEIDGYRYDVKDVAGAAFSRTIDLYRGINWGVRVIITTSTGSSHLTLKVYRYSILMGLLAVMIGVLATALMQHLAGISAADPMLARFYKLFGLMFVTVAYSIFLPLQGLRSGGEWDLMRSLNECVTSAIFARPITVSDAQLAESADAVRWYHVVLGLIPYIGIPWGIVNLRRSRRRSGLFMLAGSGAVVLFFAIGLIVALIYGKR